MIGQTISHYKILEKLGEGGMGVVYKAEDTKLRRAVALKFLPSDLTRDPEAKQRFMNEAQAVSALQHSNICTIHDIDQTKDGQLFMVMDCYDGETLKKKIEYGPLKIDNAIEIAIEVAQGLSKAHEKGIVHRDIKPANILITTNGVVKILDFGLAKLRGVSNLTKTGTTLGTVAYMSPEQARGKEVDYRSDIWSLGVVLYEMLSGCLPFGGEYEAALLYSIVNEDPKPLKNITPILSSQIKNIINRALNKNQELRYSSTTELLENLVKIQKKLIESKSGITDIRSFLSNIRKPMVVVPAIVVLVALIVFASWIYYRWTKVEWSRNQALPEIVRLIEEENYIAAFQLAKQAEKYISEDPLLLNLWPQISRRISIHTIPNDADVYFDRYENVDQKWDYMGRTPIDSVRLPLGYFKWKVKKEGFETIDMATSLPQRIIQITLDEIGSIPPGMVRVQGGMTGMGVTPNLVPFTVKLDDFFISKYEVTNRQFKTFVDSGGYQNPSYWKYEFIKNGKTISFTQALMEFKDATGRAGPANWELGTFPEGKEEYPVSGISWYEAAAFAEFSGLALPTIFHWFLAADCINSSKILPLSNFGDSGASPVGKHQGLSACGTFDMGGNVREWCFNANGEKRFIRGGAWSDPEYMFSQVDAKYPFDRSLTNGFRCIKYLTSSSSLTKSNEPVPLNRPRDYSKEKPVSDVIFRIYERLLSYDKIDLDPEIVLRDESPKYWIKQKVYYNAVRRGDRMFAYLFLPKNVPPPYQTLIIFPGAGAFDIRSSEEGENLWSWYTNDLIIRSGRAVFYPVYQSMFERGDGYGLYNPMTTINDHREHILSWRKELGRSIDYLETRSDIDCGKLCYYGSSWGSLVGTAYLAVEKRIKTGIFRLSGLPTWEWPSEMDAINFVPHIEIPILMLNGKYDYLFPYETSQKPLLRFLGTPEQNKRLEVFPTDHSLSGYTKETARLVLDWLDRYMGKVKEK